MKQRIQVLILLTILLGLSTCKKNDSDIIFNKHYLKEIKELRKEFALYMESNFIPGASFAIAKNGEIIYSEGMGYASKELNVRANRTTKFRIAEVSELFTSVIYQLMVQEGILNPDSSVQYYLPEFPQKKYALTLKDLAYHTSGIRTPFVGEHNWNGSVVLLHDNIEKLKNDTLLFEPKSFQHPSTFNFDLLGAIMEKTSNKAFSTLLKEYITDTLNLSNTEIDHPLKLTDNRTDFFENNIVSLVMNAPFCDLCSRTPSEGILSNAEDLVKFGNAILFSDAISATLKTRLFEPITLKSGEISRYSNGWIVTRTNNGRILYGMGGSVIGGGATLLIYPEEQLVIAATVNLTLEMNDLPVSKITALLLD